MTKQIIETNIFDSKTNRRMDNNGRLIVDRSLITRACVSKYWGKEIPNYQVIGLEGERQYNVLRPAEELEKCIEEFNRIPLLKEHIFDTADNPQKEIRTGSVSNAEIKDGKVYASLTVWDEDAIRDIQNESKRDLSVGYSCDFVKESGEYEGVPYELVMRNIGPNHLALVDRGRVNGAEVFDGKNIKKGEHMAIKEKVMAAIAKIFDAEPEPKATQEEVKDGADVLAEVKSLISELGEEKSAKIIALIEPAINGAKDDSMVEEHTEGDAEAKEGLNKFLSAEEKETPEPENKEAGAAKAEQEEKATKEVMDSAIKLARAEMLERETAKEEVRSVAGNLGILDSAAAYYKAGCEALGVETKEAMDSAFKYMFTAAKAVSDKKAAKALPIMDKASAESAEKDINAIIDRLPSRTF
jgi:hypothetical protein